MLPVKCEFSMTPLPPSPVNVDRGADSSPSSAANQSVGGGGDDIPDKLATPIRQPGRPPLRLRNRAETHSRWPGRGLPALRVLALPGATTGAGALSVVARRRLRQP